MKQKNNKRLQSTLQVLVVLAVLVILNIIGSMYYAKWDLTEDNRFTLSEATYSLVESFDDVVTVTVYLEGEFPAQFKRLRESVRDMLDEFNSRSPYIEYQFINPLSGDLEADRTMAESLRDKGLFPINLSVRGEGKESVQLVFPGALIEYKGRTMPVTFLNGGGGVGKGATGIEAINASINLLEYKFAHALQKIRSQQRPRVGILTGHGELDRPFTNELEKALFENYDIGRVHLDSVNFQRMPELLDALIVPKPLGPLGEQHKFILDQYIMKGGKVLWLIDANNADLDSLRRNEQYVGLDRKLDIFSMLFDYGVRINTNFALDWEAASIPVQIGMINENEPQIGLKPWYYFVRAYPYQTPAERAESGSSTIDHPIVKNLDYVFMRFPATIDTIRTQYPIRKTPLLRTSRYSKVQFPPTRISLDIIDAGLQREQFSTHRYENLAVLLEGQFPSHFKNRIAPSMEEALKRQGIEIVEEGPKNGKMIVVADGDVAKNDIDARQQEVFPLGMNRYEGRVYGNKEFLLNCIEYLIDDTGIITARNKEFKYRPLDKERAQKQASLWNFVNIGMPLLVIALFGVVYAILRRRRYARPAKSA